MRCYIATMFRVVGFSLALSGLGVSFIFGGCGVDGLLQCTSDTECFDDVEGVQYLCDRFAENGNQICRRACASEAAEACIGRQQCLERVGTNESYRVCIDPSLVSGG